MKMKRKHLLCCLTVAAMLGGCGPESLEKTPQERQTQTADMAQNGKRESGTKRETSGNEGQSEREENSQFADGFGLIEEESPRVYQLAEEDTPFTESALARADLVFAAQQEGKFWFTAVITDYSVEEADEETALREIDHNPAYFKIEETGESGQETFYGYSPYLERINDTEQTEPVRIEGTNIEKAGYAPGRLVQKTSSLSRLPSGSFIMNFGYFMEDFYSCPGEPEGEYRLYLPGFENPIVFEMEAAPALEGKQEHSEKAVSESSSAWEELGKGISGTAEGDGYKLFVRAKQKGTRTAVELYTWSKEGYQVNPQKMKLYYRPAEPEGERIACPVLWENPYSWQEEPADGSAGGVQGMQIVFEMPEEARKELQTGKAGHFQAVMEGITLVGTDESQMVNIPVPSPGETRTLEQTVSFRDCQIRLLKVAAQKRTEEEKKESGTDADVLLHVSASVTDRSERQTFTFAQIEREGERKTVSYARTGWPEFPDEGGGVQPETVMTGFSLLSSGSEESVSARIYAPSYWCPETVIIPLKIDNLNL